MKEVFEDGYLLLSDQNGIPVVLEFEGNLYDMVDALMEKLNISFIYLRADINYGYKINDWLKIAFKEYAVAHSPTYISNLYECKYTHRGALIFKDNVPADFIEMKNSVISEEDSHKPYICTIHPSPFVRRGGKLVPVVDITTCHKDLVYSAAVGIPTELKYKKVEVGNSIVLKDIPTKLSLNQIVELAIFNDTDIYSYVDGSSIKVRDKIVKWEAEYGLINWFEEGSLKYEGLYNSRKWNWLTNKPGYIVVEFDDNSMLTFSDHGEKLIRYMVKYSIPLFTVNIATIDRNILWINKTPISIPENFTSIEQVLDAYID